MADDNPEGMSDILLSLQTNDESSETLLPTLTLYTGERIYSDPKPPVNLQLSLGGSYSENSYALHESAAADNSSMMKRSYLEHNKIALADQEEIILINNVQGVTGGKQKSKRKDGIDLERAAQSATQNPALLRALKLIKSEVGHQRAATTTKADQDQRDTSDNSHATPGVEWQRELVFQALEPGNSNNPDDFLSLTPSKCAANVDTGFTMPSEEPANEASITSSVISPAENDVSGVAANAELLPLGNLAMVDKPSERPTLSATYVSYYDDTSGDGNLMTNFCGSMSGLYYYDLMYYNSYIAPAADANSLPSASAFASNPWTNVVVPIYGSTMDGGSNVVIPPVPAKEHPLKRSDYVPDSEIELIRRMPTVATNGGIPDGRRIEGFLYKYSKYEEVVIVCACHGGFFSPKEFVMHAGSGEVENPMKLISMVTTIS